MRLLAIETATTVCGAAVAVDGTVVAVVEADEKNIHAEKLLTFAGRAMASAGVTPALLDGVAVSIGPGSFTGLRIGLSVAKGLAFALGKPLVAVSTLDALALRVVLEDRVGPGEGVLAVLDARRNEVYCRLFGAAGGVLEPVWEERDLTVPDLIVQLADRPVVLIGDGSEKVAPAGEVKGLRRIVPPLINRCSAGMVARIGSRKLERGETESTGALEPHYIKEFYTRAQ